MTNPTAQSNPNTVWGIAPDIDNNNLLTLVFQNINGWKGSQAKLKLLKTQLNPDIIGFVELNCQLSETKKTSIQQQFQTEFQFATISAHHNRDNHHSKSNYKPGGTLIGATRNLVGHVTGKGGDDLGRWSSITLGGTNGRIITIISAYRVGKNLTAGPNTFYSQLIREQERLQQDNNSTYNYQLEPSQQTVRDLRVFIEDLQHKNHEIIVMIDANENSEAISSNISNPNHSVLRMFQHINLVSAYTIFTGNMDNLPNTHINGSSCIDYIYVSRNIFNSVTSISIMPFSEGFPSDHRAIVLQLKKEVLLNHNRTDMTRPQNRLFKTTEVKRCLIYQEELTRLMDSHRITERLDDIVEELNESPTPSRIEQLNKLDKEFGQYITAAARKANKGNTSLDWSPAISYARLQYRYWKVRVQMKIYNLEISTYWIQLTTEVNLGNQLIHERMSLEETQEALNRATTHLQSVKKNHIPLRIIHLQELADHYAVYDSDLSATILKRILKSEEMKTHYNRITTLFKGAKSPLTSLIIPNPTNTGFEITSDPDIMFQTLKKVNVEKLKASENTPFILGPLRGLDTDGFTLMASNILSGDFDTFDLTPVQQIFIKELSKTLTRSTTNFLSSLEFKKMIMNTRESTSSSPSGRHYGIYRAGVQEDKLLHIHATMAIQPFKHGFILDRWKQVIQIMIKKKTEPRYDSLRIIEIFEGDYAAMTKLMMRTIMDHLEKAKDTVAGTYATVRGGSTHQAIFSRVWSYDIARIRRSPIATIDNDSIGAYDRMVPQLLSIIIRRIGISDNATKTFILQLIQRSRRIQTAFGLSDPIETITPDGKMEYLGGIGQGNPGGPICYHAQLIPMIRTMENLTPGYNILDPSGKIKYTQHISSYVDDCNSLINIELEQARDKKQLTKELTALSQQTISIWTEIIQLTGGDISIPKSFWTICPGWEEKKGKVIPIQLEHILPYEETDIYIGSQPFPRKEASCCERYLGVRVGLSGDMQVEHAYRMQQSRDFAELVLKLTSRTEAVIAYRSYYRPKFDYPLGVTTMTKHQLQQIESPCINALLTKMGYNRHFPRAIVFGPIEYGGMGLKNLYFQQGFLQIKGFLNATREETTVTPLLRILMRTMQLEAGTSHNQLQSSWHRKRILSYLTSTWLTNLATFLEDNGLNIHMSDDLSWRPPLQRANDSYLMDIFLQRTPPYKTSELRSINRVRIYLQIYSRSCASDGQSISSHLYSTKNCDSPARRKSNLQWPIAQPKASDWSIWKKALAYINQMNNHIKPRLGDWVYTHQSRRENIILERRFITQAPITTTQQAMEDRPTYQRRILGLYETFQNTIDQLLRDFSENSEEISIIAGCDGGNRENEGQAAHAYTLRTNNEDIMILGVAPTDGQPMTSYRPELLGIFGVLISLEALSKTLPQQGKHRDIKIQVEIFSDNKSAIQMSQDQSDGKYISPTVAEYDTLAEIKALQQRLTQFYRITYTWIKGHQTRQQGVGDPRGIQINIDMDKMCNDYMNEALNSPTYMSTNLCPFFPCSKTAICIGERILHTDIYNQLDMHINGPTIRQQMETKNGWETDQFEMIDWIAHGKTLRNMQMHTRPTTHKAIHGWMYTGSWEAKIHNTEPHCNLCDSIDDNDHILTCIATTDQREKAFNIFNNSLTKLNTAPVILASIKSNLKQILAFPPTPLSIYINPSDPIDQSVLQTTTQQHNIGWNHFLKGRLSKGWGLAQEQYLTLFPDRRAKKTTGSRWAVKVIEAALILLRTIWQARNDAMNKSPGEGPTIKEHNTRQWVHKFYENQETMVPPTERLRLFDLPLADRLETAPKLQVLWLQTVQLIANRYNPRPLQRAETESSIFRFYNRVRPPEPSESDSDDEDHNNQERISTP